MLKFRKIMAIIITFATVFQLLSITALAEVPTLKGMPKQTLVVSFSSVQNSSGLRLTVELGFPWNVSASDFSAFLQETQPVLETWTYVGDAYVFNKYSLSDLKTYLKDGYPCANMFVDLEDTDNVYAELVWNSGQQSEEYEENLGGWRPTRFGDVARGLWYYTYVDYAANVLELMNGKGGGSYAPDDNMTYAEAIALAARISVRLKGGKNYTFQQISGKPWYQTYLNYAAQYGIPCAYPDYNAKVTRAEYAHIFFAAFPQSFYYEAINTVSDGSIPDVPMNSDYASEIYALYRAGIFSGSDSVRNFKPNDYIKRSEVATIVCRMCGYERQNFSL
ncbi:MAG: S-layer homology domain-containing protein [Oscillospiraceae bacterium]|nr:S-layer homology domain-containing protein [Oscillospiraceae bacterium]